MKPETITEESVFETLKNTRKVIDVVYESGHHMVEIQTKVDRVTDRLVKALIEDGRETVKLVGDTITLLMENKQLPSGRATITALDMAMEAHVQARTEMNLPKNLTDDYGFRPALNISVPYLQEITELGGTLLKYR
jgi:hypothetical protein